MPACWCQGKCPHIALPRKMTEAGRPAHAHAVLRKALTIAPLCVEANLAIAGILTRGNHAVAAKGHLDKAEQVEGLSARVLLARAESLRGQARLEEAVFVFNAATKANPENPLAFAGLAAVLEMLGEAKRTLPIIETAAQTWPENPVIRRNLGTVYDALGDWPKAIALLTPASGKIEPIDYLDRGRYLEKLGRYDDAWGDWMAGKQLLRDNARHFYDSKKFGNIFADLARSATATRVLLSRAAPPLELQPTPLFVTGFPRSGTTLIENVLSQHPRIVAGDEIMGISEVIDAMPRWLKVPMRYPAAMLATGLGENAAIPGLLRDLYYRTSQERIGFKAARRGARRGPLFFTDKMPLNEMHVPLIRLLFWDAPIVHVRRHPLDVMVSCMANFLVFGGYYASSLEACATHYLRVDQLLQHYAKALPDGLGRFVQVPYETFLYNPVIGVANLAAFLGIDAAPAMLNPHKNPRHARTISYRQVKQPLHDKSVGRWRNFRAHLGPAVEILKPILEREEYEF